MEPTLTLAVVFASVGAAALVGSVVVLVWTFPQEEHAPASDAKAQKKQQKQKLKKQLKDIDAQGKQIQEDIAQKQQEQQQQQTLQKDLSAQEPADTPESWLERLTQGMSKTRNFLQSGLGTLVLGKKEIDEDVLDGLEELLLEADLGPETTERILNSITQKMGRQELNDPEALSTAIQSEITRILSGHTPPTSKETPNPYIVMFVGVNGVGKTTTIGKLAHRYHQEGKRVLLGAGDTFRAAAIEQLEEWSKRVGCDIIKKEPDSDPSAVIYQTVQQGVEEGYDVIMCDTAGRLHTKKNLMEELKKMVRVVKKIVPDAPHDVLLVLDATTGQNAIFQAREFSDTADLTGMVVTKLDGTAKGGVVIGIVNEFEIPIRYIGIGEGIEHLRDFDAEQFAKSLF